MPVVEAQGISKYSNFNSGKLCKNKVNISLFFPFKNISLILIDLVSTKF